MKMKKTLFFLSGTTVFALTALLVAAAQPPQANQMTFFVTSTGSGNGANLGGLAGADALCQKLAASVGAGNRTWRAYLSANPQGQAAVNARDRIGTGPWRNIKGVQIAASVAELHSDKNGMTKETNLTEKGTVVNGVGDQPNQHDVLTGSQADGTAFTDGMDHTCSNWTSSADGMGSAQLGHADRMGRGAAGSSWNSTHASRGCSQANLVATGGNGYFYCFATN